MTDKEKARREWRVLSAILAGALMYVLICTGMIYAIVRLAAWAT